MALGGAWKSALNSACHQGRLEVVRLLLEDSRVDPAIDGQHPLRIAVSAGRLDVTQLLLEQPTVDPSAEGHDALRRAIRHNSSEPIRVLLENERTDLEQVILLASTKPFFGELLNHPRIQKHLFGLPLEALRSSPKANPRLSHLWRFVEDWKMHGWAAIRLNPLAGMGENLAIASGLTLAFYHRTGSNAPNYAVFLRLILPYLGLLSPWRLEELLCGFYPEGDKFLLARHFIDLAERIIDREGEEEEERWRLYQILGRLYCFGIKEGYQSWTKQLHPFLSIAGYFQ